MPLRQDLGRFGLGLVVVGAASCLAGCGDEDRVLTARCEVTRDDFAAATFPLPDSVHETIGGFNDRQEALGTLFRIRPDPSEAKSALWNRAYSLVGPATSVSHEVYWSSQTFRARLKLDLDGEALAESSRATMESILQSRTGFIVWDVERQVIPDVLAAVNDDSGALGTLEVPADDARYLILSSRLLGMETGFYYAPGGGIWLSDGRGSASIPFIAIGTFRLGNTNYHTRFPCALVEELNSKAAARKARVPAVAFYTAVRYDPATRKAVRDPRAIDLDFLRSAVQATHGQP